MPILCLAALCADSRSLMTDRPTDPGPGSSATLPMAESSPACGGLKLTAEVTQEAFPTEPLAWGSSASVPLLGTSGDSFPPSQLLCLEQGQHSSVSFVPQSKQQNRQMENGEAVRRASAAEETKLPPPLAQGQQLRGGSCLAVPIT